MDDSDTGPELSDKLEQLSRKLREMEEARRIQEQEMALLQTELEKARQQLAVSESVAPTEEEELPAGGELEFVPCDPQVTELIISDVYPADLAVIKTEDSEETISVEGEGENFFTNPSQDLLVVSKEGGTWYVCLKCKKAFKKKIFWRRHVYRHYFFQFLQMQSKKANTCNQQKSRVENFNLEEIIYMNSSSSLSTRVKRAKYNRCSRCGRKFKNRRFLERHLQMEKHVCNLHSKNRKSNPSKALRNHRVKHWSEKPASRPCSPEITLVPEDVTEYADEEPLMTDSTEKEALSGVESPSRNNSEAEDPLNENSWSDFEQFITIKKTRNRPRRTIVCRFCGKVFRKQSDLSAHENYHLGLKPFPCKDCNKFFGSKSNLIKHEQQVHSKVGPVLCEVCGQAFSSRSTLKQHLQVHSEEKPFTCKECGKSFRRKANLQVHTVIHSHMKPFVCSFCGKRLCDKLSLRDHELRHQGIMPYRCEMCGEEFKHNYMYFNHKKAHRESTQSEEVNDEHFTSNFSIEEKKIKQKKKCKPKLRVKNFTCLVCNKSFISNASLLAHSRIHSGERPFECSVCQKRFRQMATLKTHQINHQVEKPHTCSFCGKGFSLKSILRAHETTHTGVRVFPCKHCEKSFKQLAHLLNHERIVHEGVRDCYCPTCGKAFTSKSNLRQHEKIHLPQEILPCPICDKTFTNKYRLSSHLKLHSREDSDAVARLSPAGTGFLHT